MVGNPKVSVITPIYNVARYLPQCLESLKAQTLDDIEFICINDGSTDESLSILNEYAQDDDRFVVIDKPNSGYGATMNCGLKAARGEYIGIVESDDFVDADAFELLYGLAQLSNRPDIVKANHYRYNETQGDRFVENYTEDMCDKVLSPLEEPGVRVIGSVPAIWAAIYRSDFVRENGIDFLETPGASFQDTGFVFKSWLAAETFVLCYAAFLHYRIDNAGSSVKDPSKVYYVCDEFASIERFLEARPERSKSLMPHLAAKKFDTYEWNLRRIDVSFRTDFLKRCRLEFLQAREAGLLEESLYSPTGWERLNRLLDQFDSLAVESQLDGRRRSKPKVSVIVPVYNAMPFLKRTLSFLRRQTIPELEVIIVNDGSTDRSQNCIDDFCARDARFKAFYQENKGVSAARNLALEHVTGEYVAFCDADDIVPIGSYEGMYRAAVTKDADIVVGREDEFTLTSDTVYARSEWLSRRSVISKYDVDFNWNLSLCNKLFRAEIIKEHDLRFGDAEITEDGIYLCEYLKYAQRITGYPYCVYKYRRHHFFEAKSATQRVDRKAVSSYFESMDEVKRLRLACAEYDIERLPDNANHDLTVQEIQAKSAIASEDVDYRTLSFAIERYYRWIWRLNAKSLKYLNRQLARLRDEKVYSRHWEDICSYNADLRLEEGFKTHAQFAKHVEVSVIITPQETKGRFMRLVNSVRLQRFPSYELFIPDSCEKWMPKSFLEIPNVHVTKASNRMEMIEHSLKKARGKYVNILEDRIYHSSNTLREMWKRLEGSRVDFVSVNLSGINNKSKARELTAVPFLYTAEFTDGPSVRSKFLVIDSSLNNKLFRTEALAKLAPLTNTPTADAKRAFNTLSYVKAPDLFMACFEGDAFFLNRVSEKMRTAFDMYGRLRAKCPYKLDSEETIPTIRRSKSQILFCSNRENNRLSASMQLVYDALPDVEKLVFCEPLPHSKKYLKELKRALMQSKVIVTDDYIHELLRIPIRDDQSVIQLWHACGALKMFGLDNVICDRRGERAKHAHYDAVMVSDESVRGVYARAFGVKKDVVKAFGVPRTDKLLDEASLQSTRAKVYKKYPGLKGKEIILYCPTFREIKGKQTKWDTGIDWVALDKSLDKNQVFIIKPHPLEISSLQPRRNLKHIRSDIAIGTDELMTVADLLITDCSSIVFDYSLLEKPMVFYFPDIDTFSRNYYIDFPEGVDAEVVKTSDELKLSIQRALANPDDYLVSKIRNGMMGACDGHSTERIAAYIMQRFND